MRVICPEKVQGGGGSVEAGAGAAAAADLSCTTPGAVLWMALLMCEWVDSINQQCDTWDVPPPRAICRQSEGWVVARPCPLQLQVGHHPNDSTVTQRNDNEESVELSRRKKSFRHVTTFADMGQQ